MKRLIVETEYGKVEGLHGWDPRVAVYKGIPYAAPPVGELRFHSPIPHEKWDGIRPAFDYAPVSMQYTPGDDKDSFWTKEMHPTGPEYEVSEDCLYLNVFTPARDNTANLPVLFYIHGGGFLGGYPSEIEFDWEHMAARGIVVVSIQYRLGILGFLACKELSLKNPDAPKGNYGIEDQIAALSWTVRNIKEFGGNPDMITIAGQSAGAMSVQCLLASPLTKGMIHGAIIESSVAGDFEDMPTFAYPVDRTEAVGDKFMLNAGYETLDELMAADAQTLIEQVDTALGAGFHFQPTVDGIVLKESPFEAYKNNNHHNVPIISGYNRGETRVFNKSEDDADIGTIVATRMFGYLQYSQGRKSYLYEFDGDIPGDDNVGSYHGSEMWFAYDALARCDRAFVGKHYDLARQISSYWVNFVKTGDPNGKDKFGFDLPRWESFTPDNEFLMLFEDEPKKLPLMTTDKMKNRMEEKIGKKLW